MGKDCAHPACSCEAEPGKEFCSEQCRNPSEPYKRGCECKHTICSEKTTKQSV